jgi:glycosyltransferase involved in cell wall biosynthesis
MNCSLVIRSYNEEQHIGRLLSGILEQSLEDIEVLLVDSGSTDATLAIASRYPVTILSIRPEEFSFGRSLNIGCQAANMDFIVIASAHVYPVYPDWLEQILAPFEDPNIALVYGRQRGDRRTKFSEARQLTKMFPSESYVSTDQPFCNNANAAIRKSLWSQNPYDEELTGLEDIAWAAWALSQGYTISYSAEAEVVHVHEETPGQVYNRYRREAMALRRIKQDEDFSFSDLIRLYWSNVISDLAVARRTGVFSRHWKTILWFRWMQFYGTYRGFQEKGALTSELKQVFYYPGSPRLVEREPIRQLQPIDYSYVEKSDESSE